MLHTAIKRPQQACITTTRNGDDEHKLGHNPHTRTHRADTHTADTHIQPGPVAGRPPERDKQIGKRCVGQPREPALTGRRFVEQRPALVRERGSVHQPFGC